MSAAPVAYLLDTNTCIQILNGHSNTVDALRARSPGAIRLCSIVISELSYGAHNSRNADANLARLRQFCAPFQSLPFDDQAAEECGQLRADLRRRGKPVGPNDLLIAAIARVHGLVLVTHDTAEFSRVPELRMEDWQAN